jgi:ATP-dependent DNA ligase
VRVGSAANSTQHWIFEPKLDGFRAVAYVDKGASRLVSPNQNLYKSFPALTATIGRR